MIKIFIDGREGTTGLRIHERLEGRVASGEATLIVLPEELRKDSAARANAINSSDVTFLCLPDAAAKESVALCINPNTVIIDASTAHRTEAGWAYGFPELSVSHRDAIRRGKRIAVPGCHASGFAAIVYPLVKTGVIAPDYPLVCTSLTGYSGGGKAMIAEYQAEVRDISLSSPRQYATAQAHKHLPEMAAVCGLAYPPLFSPIVADFYAGMEVTVAIRHTGGADFIRETLAEHYRGQKMVRVLQKGEHPTFIAANKMTGRDDMELIVDGTADRVVVMALFDNLGKGASGAAVQCMNIALGSA